MKIHYDLKKLEGHSDERVITSVDYCCFNLNKYFWHNDFQTPFCFNGHEDEIVPNRGGGQLTLIYDPDYSGDPISYCPFCGSKIEYIKGKTLLFKKSKREIIERKVVDEYTVEEIKDKPSDELVPIS